MSKYNYNACLKAISEQHGKPPTEFLDTLVDTIEALPNDVFSRNDKYDIYSVMNGVLGPYADLLHRKAVMCEVLRVVAAFESDWDWNEGVDTGKPKSKFKKIAEETGAFQVSFDSMSTDKSLQECLDKHEGRHDVETFITAMKSNHKLAVEYCARLFRFDTTWCGTVKNKNMVISHVSRNSVEEFKSFLSVEPIVADNTENPVSNDSQHINDLVHIASNPANNFKSLKDIQNRAAKKLLVYDGDKYPTNGCAITLSLILQDAGIPVKDIYMAIELTNILRKKRNWGVIPNGSQQSGDIGTTCGTIPNHGYDHIYLVVERKGNDEMVIVDNQKNEPHTRFASGKGGKTPTKYFLRAV
ncbi:hypothetical protein [Chryseobacterium shigense]|uniref:Uncharacterized protein n=1 Tax=Chryseobacterium shigense TaxID=297244 RepID=A0A841NEG9_9FLAO|nr:hypothetical protein [Chryseobacterium shigense]MBB6370442.1 hypothetical protein [Chryseobacterium shigense]